MARKIKLSRQFKRSTYREFTFECQAGHRTKHWCWDNVTSKPCCKFKAHRVLPQYAKNAQGAEPTVYYVTPQGKMIVPGRANAKPPKDATKHEIRTFRDRDRFYKQLNQQAASEHAQFKENSDRFFGDGIAEGRSELHRYLAQGQVPEVVFKDGQEVATGRMIPLTSEGRDFIQHALSQPDALDRFDPSCSIDAWENDRPSYQDVDTAFRNREY